MEPLPDCLVLAVLAPTPTWRTTLSEVTITVKENGSLKIEGDTNLVDHEGNSISKPEGRPYSLCRCGASENKPFCDGSHKRIEFKGTLAQR